MQLNLFSCYLLFYLVTLILMNSFESCLDLFNHSKRWCNFEFSIWFSFRKTSKLVNPLVKTCWSNTFWIIFSLVWFIWHSCKRWCNINPLNMFKLVWTFRKMVQFRNFYLVLLQKMVQYKISLSWSILIYLNLSLYWSIPIYIYLYLSQSILIYHNCFDTHLL